jgi:glycosyltransferase involved in cell wall biosynthesis
MARERSPRQPGVLIVVQNLPVPLDRRVWQEALAMVDAGYQVSVICPRGADEPAHRKLDGVHIYSYAPPPAAKGVLGFVSEFAYCWLRTAILSMRVARRNGFDVLQACNPPDTYWLLGLLHKIRGRRFVFDQHDLCPEVYEARFGARGPLHRMLLMLERATYWSADAVIATNESYRSVAVRRGGLSEPDVAIVRSSPDPDTMYRADPVPQLRHGRKHLVCYLGIMGPQDGVDRLLAAIDVLVHVMGRTDVHFGLLGFGDCLDELRSTAVERGLSDVVTFTGRADAMTIRRWLSTADIGVTPDPPTRFNDLSTMNKTMEYMAHELPVVSFALTENARSAGEAGLMVDDDDTALAAAISELLDDPDRRRNMGKLGRERIVSELSWQRQVPTYVGVFDKLVGRTSGFANPASTPPLAG